jgi:quercetin dioxygenase-like cupin family protein
MLRAMSCTAKQNRWRQVGGHPRGEENEMRVLHSRKKWIALGALLLAGTLGVGVAVATVTATVFADTHDVRLRIVRSEFVPSADQPMFSSGWHTHPGPVIIQVQKGRFNITDANCKRTILGPGESYIETPELPLIVTAKKAVTWTTSFILPDSPPKPLATPVPDPCSGEDGD